MCGYTLIGNCKAEKFFIFAGTGANGKSVLGRVLMHVIGTENISSVSLKSFDETFGLTPIIGKLVNIASENECNIINSTETLKSITSGEMVTINAKYKSAIETIVTTKLIFLTNNLPQFKDVSTGLLRRIKLVPFNNHLQAEDINPNLYDELIKERNGIFTWLVEGAIRLIRNNYVFTASNIADMCLDRCKEALNPIEIFVKDKLEVAVNERLSHTYIRATYTDWLNKNSYSSNVMDNPNKFWSVFRNAIQDVYGSPVQEIKSNIRYVVGYRIKEAKTDDKPRLQKHS